MAFIFGSIAMERNHQTASLMNDYQTFRGEHSGVHFFQRRGRGGSGRVSPIFVLFLTIYKFFDWDYFLAATISLFNCIWIFSLSILIIIVQRNRSITFVFCSIWYKRIFFSFPHRLIQHKPRVRLARDPAPCQSPLSHTNFLLPF